MSDQPEQQRTASPSSEENNLDEGEVLQWTTHPARRNLLKTALVTLFITLVSVIAWYATETFGFGLLALVVLTLSTARYFVPTTYRLSDRRIMIKTMTQTIYKDWSVYRSFYPDKSGVLLSPFVEPSRLENFRGVYLMFEDNRQEVVDFIRTRIGGPAPKTTSSADEGERP